eukprot:m.180018 g.180018  ORF g.180018 m.180018 type:complete len:337 (+) comp14651_c3_seq2:253-1263(+)
MSLFQKTMTDSFQDTPLLTLGVVERIVLFAMQTECRLVFTLQQVHPVWRLAILTSKAIWLNLRTRTRGVIVQVPEHSASGTLISAQQTLIQACHQGLRLHCMWCGVITFGFRHGIRVCCRCSHVGRLGVWLPNVVLPALPYIPISTEIDLHRVVSSTEHHSPVCIELVEDIMLSRQLEIHSACIIQSRSNSKLVIADGVVQPVVVAVAPLYMQGICLMGCAQRPGETAPQPFPYMTGLDIRTAAVIRGCYISSSGSGILLQDGSNCTCRSLLPLLLGFFRRTYQHRTGNTTTLSRYNQTLLGCVGSTLPVIIHRNNSKLCAFQRLRRRLGLPFWHP